MEGPSSRRHGYALGSQGLLHILEGAMPPMPRGPSPASMYYTSYCCIPLAQSY